MALVRDRQTTCFSPEINASALSWDSEIARWASDFHPLVCVEALNYGIMDAVPLSVRVQHSL